MIIIIIIIIIRHPHVLQELPPQGAGADGQAVVVPGRMQGELATYYCVMCIVCHL